MKVIAVINQKGGVGKTTTVLTLLAGLTKLGYRTLAIDLDAQRNLSQTFEADAKKPGILEVLLGVMPIEAVIQATEQGDIVTAKEQLAGADAFITDAEKEYKIRNALKDVAHSYDYVLLDTPRGLGVLSTNALTAADAAIIPVHADKYSMDGLLDLYKTIDAVKKHTNPDLVVDGILFTRFAGRTVLAKDIRSMVEEYAESQGTRVYQTVIREANAVKEAQMLGVDIFRYAPKGKVTEDYQNFIRELLKIGE